VIRDVHSGGPVAAAGLKPGDVIVSVNGKQIWTPAQPMFPMGAEAAITVEREGSQIESVLAIPRHRSRKQPYSEPQSVLYSKLTDAVGHTYMAHNNRYPLLKDTPLEQMKRRR
jgi:predicted metalloprotease with PDZ domain